MEEDGALEHSIAFAGMAKNSAGGIYKNGATKPFEEKTRVAQMWIDMTGANPHNNQPSIRMLANAAKVSGKFEDCSIDPHAPEQLNGEYSEGG
jgi:hypothetical protein